MRALRLKDMDLDVEDFVRFHEKLIALIPEDQDRMCAYLRWARPEIGRWLTELVRQQREKVRH